VNNERVSRAVAEQYEIPIGFSVADDRYLSKGTFESVSVRIDGSLAQLCHSLAGHA
jgi:hypothetical protein